jgi:hypothetical protein
MRKQASFVGFAALLASSSIAGAQSLADVARAEEARRKTVTQPAKVYTNDDLKQAGNSAPPPAPAQPGATPAAGAATAGSATTGQPAASADTSTKDEKYWKDRITSAREALAHSKVLVDALQSRVNALTTDFVNTSDPAQRAVVENNRNTALAEMDRLTKEIAKQTKAITDIDEEARKASVPAGWLR